MTVAVAEGGTISGTVWDDDDQDGILDVGEAGIGGVQIWLLDIAGNMVATAVTNSNGGYTFDDLAAGQYRIRVILDGEDIGPPPQSSGGDNDVDGLGYSALLEVVAGSLFDIDAGLIFGAEPPGGGG